MPHPALWLVGLELHRFAPVADPAEAVATSMAADATRTPTIHPYLGPALQPYAGLHFGQLALIAAPSLAFRREELDGSEVKSSEWRMEGRARWEGGRWFAGADLALAGGAVRYEGEQVADSPTYLELGPTAGFVLALGPHMGFVARARWPIRIQEIGPSADFNGALGMEWRR